MGPHSCFLSLLTTAACGQVTLTATSIQMSTVVNSSVSNVPGGTVLVDGWTNSTASGTALANLRVTAPPPTGALTPLHFDLTAAASVPFSSSLPFGYNAAAHGEVLLSLASGSPGAFLLGITITTSHPPTAFADIGNDGSIELQPTQGVGTLRQTVTLGALPVDLRLGLRADAFSPFAISGSAQILVELVPVRCVAAAAGNACGLQLSMEDLGFGQLLLRSTTSHPGVTAGPIALEVGFQPQALTFPFVPGCPLLVTPILERVTIVPLGSTTLMTLDTRSVPGPLRFRAQSVEALWQPPLLWVHSSQALIIDCN